MNINKQVSVEITWHLKDGFEHIQELLYGDRLDEATEVFDRYKSNRLNGCDSQNESIKQYYSDIKSLRLIVDGETIKSCVFSVDGELLDKAIANSYAW